MLSPQSPWVLQQSRVRVSPDSHAQGMFLDPFSAGIDEDLQVSGRKAKKGQISNNKLLGAWNFHDFH